MQNDLPTNIGEASDDQLAVELDAIKNGAGYYCLGELEVEIERRKAASLDELRDREQIARAGLRRRVSSYLDIAKCNIEADLVKDAERDLARKQALADMLIKVRGHLEAAL